MPSGQTPVLVVFDTPHCDSDGVIEALPVSAKIPLILHKLLARHSFQRKVTSKLTTRPSSSPVYTHVGWGLMQVIPASVFPALSFLWSM